MNCNKKPKFIRIDKDIEKRLYEQVELIHTVCDSLGVKCWIIGGSLLGYARHGKQIPWDDDCDLGIKIDDLKPVYEALVRIAPSVNMKVEYTCHGLKLKCALKPNIGTDIFPYYLQGDLTAGAMEKWVLASDRSRAFWPRDYFHTHELHKFKKVKFGSKRVYIPSSHLRYLETLYGNDCMVVAKKDFNHLQNRHHEDAGIAVDLREAMKEIGEN